MRDVTAYNTSAYSSDGTQMYTGYDDYNGRIIVAIRGTDNARNWLENIDTIRVDYPNCDGSGVASNCGVHKGMYESWLSL